MKTFTSIVAILMLVGLFGARAAVAQTTEPALVTWQSAPMVSPFQAVRWPAPQVQTAGVWYELVSINDLSTDEIVQACKVADPDQWTKRFEEDLVAVLKSMGQDPGKAVTLKVKDLQSGDVQTLDHVAMTASNRHAILVAKRGMQNGGIAPAPGAASDPMKVSPFDAIRWRGDVPEVTIDGIWYEFEAINDFTADQVIANCKAWDAEHWQMRFEDDMIEAMSKANQSVGATVNLKVKELTTGTDQMLENVAVTVAKRNGLVVARLNRAPGAATQPSGLR